MPAIVAILILIIGSALIINLGAMAKAAGEYTGIQATSWLALIGVIIGQLIAFASRQLEKHSDKLKERQKSIEMSESIISNFLSKEINDNFKLIPISGIKRKLQEIDDGSKSSQYGLGSIQFQFKEYDKIKYEIIKYNNELTIEVLEIYNLFYFLMDKKDLKNMTTEEIRKIVNIYDEYVNRYLMKI